MCCCFFFNDTATTEIYTLSLHDALPILLADEPTANLDSKTGDILLDMMQKMNKEKNITFIFSSHDKQVIDRAERLLILKDGLIEE